MLQELIDLALHRYVRDRERVRIYASDGSFITENWAKVDGWGKYAPVRMRQGHPYLVIRRDQFSWSPRFCCWTYNGDR